MLFLEVLLVLTQSKNQNIQKIKEKKKNDLTGM